MSLKGKKSAKKSLKFYLDFDKVTPTKKVWRFCQPPKSRPKAKTGQPPHSTSHAQRLGSTPNKFQVTKGVIVYTQVFYSTQSYQNHRDSNRGEDAIIQQLETEQQVSEHRLGRE